MNVSYNWTIDAEVPTISQTPNPSTITGNPIKRIRNQESQIFTPMSDVFNNKQFCKGSSSRRHLPPQPLSGNLSLTISRLAF